MKRRAFTLVEILVVLCLVGLLVVPLGMLLESGYRHFIALSRTADAKSDCTQAAARIQGWLAKHPAYRLDADNHGLSGPDGVTLNLAVDVQVDSRRPVVRMHETYDYPRSSL